MVYKNMEQVPRFNFKRICVVPSSWYFGSFGGGHVINLVCTVFHSCFATFRNGQKHSWDRKYVVLEEKRLTIFDDENTIGMKIFLMKPDRFYCIAN